MKKPFNDTKIYLYFSIVTAVVTVILAVTGGYSKLIVEPQVEKLLNAEKNIDTNYKKAFLKLRDPFIFAGYDNFDREGMKVKESIAFFDHQLAVGQRFPKEFKSYLDLILKRRAQGSTLALKTMAFVFILSIISSVLFFFEKKQLREQ